MDSPLISVVVPIYNHARFVRGALDSVYRQTYPNLQLIAIDDASRDGSTEIAQQWLLDHESRRRFTSAELIRHAKNRGAHATLNEGIERARGDWIAILNSDDLFLPDRLARLLDALTRQDTEFAFSQVLAIDDTGTTVPTSLLPVTLRGPVQFADYAASNLPSLSFGFLSCNMAISTGNFMFSKRLFAAVGPFQAMRYVHDWDFALQAMLYCEPAYVPEALYHYRLHGTNSFGQLMHVAPMETLALARRLRQSIQSGDVRNSRAPTLRNWPVLLDLYAPHLSLLKQIRSAITA